VIETEREHQSLVEEALRQTLVGGDADAVDTQIAEQWRLEFGWRRRRGRGLVAGTGGNGKRAGNDSSNHGKLPLGFSRSAFYV
jgi:hypothetical protein